MSFKFQPATEQDRNYLLQLRKLTMVEHLEKAGQFLSEDQHLVRLNDQYHCSHLIIYRGESIGTLKYSEDDQELYIMQLQIHPAFQNQGLGGQILRQIFRQSSGKNIKLTVLKDNPAKKLYERHGFKCYDEDELEYHMRREQQ